MGVGGAKTFPISGRLSFMPNEPDWRDFVDAATIRRNIRAVYARLRRAGRLPDVAERRRVNAHLRKLANRAIVVHFDDAADMIDVLRSGRFQSLRELGRGDPAYLALRARTEETLFGPRPATAPDPIYGILTGTGYGYPKAETLRETGGHSQFSGSPSSHGSPLRFYECPDNIGVRSERGIDGGSPACRALIRPDPSVTDCGGVVRRFDR